MIRFVPLLQLIAFFGRQLILAQLDVARWVLSRKLNLKPAIVLVPTELESDFQLMLLSNMITLTPGTLTLEVMPQERTLLVHVFHTDEPEKVIESIKSGFETKIRGVFRS
jgi:multicomponent Na+:H+ antiporter subunit E